MLGPGLPRFVKEGFRFLSKIKEYLKPKQQSQLVLLPQSKGIIELKWHEKRKTKDVYGPQPRTSREERRRGGSLLEDSRYLPFAGIYSTYMLPISHRGLHIRLEALLRAELTFKMHERVYRLLRKAGYFQEESTQAGDPLPYDSPALGLLSSGWILWYPGTLCAFSDPDQTGPGMPEIVRGMHRSLSAGKIETRIQQACCMEIGNERSIAE